MLINALDKQERFLFAKLTLSGSQAAEILHRFSLVKAVPNSH